MSLNQTAIFGPGDSGGSGGGSGDVNGPGSSTDNALVRWNGTTGTSIQNSGATLDDNGLLSSPSTSTVTSGTVNANSFALTVTPSGASTGAYRAASLNATVTGANNISGNVNGVIHQVTHSGSGTIATVIGSSSTVSNTSNGTIDDGWGIRLSHSNSGGGTFTDYRGLAFIDSATTSTNNWAFYFDPNFVSNSRAAKVDHAGTNKFFPLSTADTGITFAGTNLIFATTGSGDVQLNPVGSCKLTSGQYRSVTVDNSATYNVLTTDYIINSTRSSTGTQSVVLPNPTTNAGQIFIVKDAGGNAGTNNITVSVSGGANIDGAATDVMSSNYASQAYYSNGTTYSKGSA